MPKFMVRVQGNGYLVDFGSEVELCGFYTTRTVRSLNPELAGSMAIEMVKNDPDLISMQKEHTSEPFCKIESVSQTFWWRRVGGAGFTFYPMDGE